MKFLVEKMRLSKQKHQYALKLEKCFLEKQIVAFSNSTVINFYIYDWLFGLMFWP